MTQSAEISNELPQAPDLALGYIGIEASDLAAWEKFGRDAIGFDVHKRDGELLFQMDDHHHRFMIAEGPKDDIVFVGWETKSEADLERLRERLRRLNVRADDLNRDELARRGVRKGYRFIGPKSLPFEAYCDPVKAAHPPKLNGLSGFVAGSSGIGHIAVGADANTRNEFETLLQTRHTDDILASARGMDLELNFLHLNQRHHSVALVNVLGVASKPQTMSAPRPRKMISHVMVEVAKLEDVGAANIRCKSLGYQLPMDTGLHPNDMATSFYVTTPSGFELEIGWGAKVITDESAWKPAVYHQTSLWGHASFGL